MKRKIIEIDEEKCNGCGQCVTGCAEGALQIIDGKAKLVKEQFCDGLGACIGDCPAGALKIIERDADAFDEEQVKVYLAKTAAPVKKAVSPPSGCPGTQSRMLEPATEKTAVPSDSMPQVIRSELSQWPVLLHLVPVQAPFFKEKEMVLLSTCSTVACPDVQWRYIRGRAVVVACPKCDLTEGYVDKLTAIIDANALDRIYVVRMQVPCCGGLSVMIRKALSAAHRSVEVREVVISVEGVILSDSRMI
ncbi:MAG: 4Fe-4S dicluster domain-containing protein [Spartobacteria bacterium]|nr:4Fe-4S dicluster domain-containing protein [Spartobacteria bacterium]